MKTLLALVLVAGSLSACSSLPTAADARDAMTRACVASASVEALTAGKQVPAQIEKVCSDPKLQAKLINVVQQATETHEAVKALLPVKGADAGAP
jgi:starvation-inducible outer membrane lipoprotein